MSKYNIKKLLKDKKDSIKKTKILCIGDIILDHDVHGVINRISPEAPVPIFLIESENYQLGGVGNVARNISNLGAKPTLFYLSSKNNSSQIINNLINKEKKINGIQINIKKYRTPIKTRYKNKLKHIIRIDNEINDFKLNKKDKEFILFKLSKEIKKHDLVVLSDYNKGMLDKVLVQQIIDIAKKYKIEVIGDQKKVDLSTYSNISLITPNQKELTDAAKKKNLSKKEIITFSKKINKKYNIKNILVTRSEKGMLLINENENIQYLATAKTVSDVTGAGDTVIAVLALMLSIGLDIKDAIMVANYAAGLVIGKYGTETINFNNLLD